MAERSSKNSNLPTGDIEIIAQRGQTFDDDAQQEPVLRRFGTDAEIHACQRGRYGRDEHAFQDRGRKYVVFEFHFFLRT